MKRVTRRGRRQRQRGMTFIGLLCILALVGAIGYAGVRLVPVYINYMKLARTMESAATEFKGEAADLAGVRKSIDRHWAIEDITGVDQKDIEITRDDGGLQLHVAYDDTVPYIANISLSVHFDKTVKVQ
jgi:type II secretory pathway pseudopilin PulG